MGKQVQNIQQRQQPSSRRLREHSSHFSGDRVPRVA
jgi:hypothetical protein